MGLRTKFNLSFLLVAVLGTGLTAVVCYAILLENAREEVIQNARFMRETALAVRGYAAEEIGPMLSARAVEGEFLPHTVPSFAAQSNMARVTEAYPDFTYAEVALNPTNPADLARDWETALIAQFRADPDLTELIGQRQQDDMTSLYLANPVRIESEACLTCHSTPAAAPSAMVRLYGAENGFGWQLGEVIGAQIISVPMRLPIDRALESLTIFVGSVAAVFALTMLILNLMLHVSVVRPITRISRIAEEVSTGNLDIPEYQERGKDEIGSLAKSFNRMRRSLVNAMKMLAGT